MSRTKFAAILFSVSILSAGCGSSGITTPVATTTSADTASTTSTATTALSLSASSSSVAEGGTVTLTASGGTAPYYYFDVSGLGTIGSSTGVFVAPTTATSVMIMATDSSGLSAYTTITVTGSSTTTTSGTLSISESSTSIASGATDTFTVSGGTAPYTYALLVGSGSLSVSGYSTSTSTVYTASSSDNGTIEIEVTDSSATPQVAYATVTVTAVISTVQLSTAFEILTDDMLGVTFYNTTSMSSPQLVFFGTGSKPNETTMFAHTAVGTCGYDIYGNTLSPCTTALSLTNYTNSSTSTTTYEGKVYFSGRSGSGSFSFCIPPGSYPSQAYILPGSMTGSASNTQFLQMAYNDSKDGRALLNGAEALSYYTETDTNGGTGNTSITVQANYTTNTACSAYSTSDMIEAF